MRFALKPALCGRVQCVTFHFCYFKHWPYHLWTIFSLPGLEKMRITNDILRKSTMSQSITYCHQLWN